MSDLTERKSQIRRAVFARRKIAYAMGRPGQAGQLSSVLAGHRGVAVSGYMPINTEISPIAAMEEASAYGVVGVPVIEAKGQPLSFARWEPGCSMQEGPFRAMIPALRTPMVPQIVIVPLVAWDRRGGRLGYGGGFYDRTLEGLRARGPVLAIGFAFNCQEEPDLPLEQTDQPLDMMVTEDRILEF